jgi:hypothetical protein
MARAKATPAGNTSGSQQPVWLDYEHPSFTALKPQWTVARDFYTGAVIQTAKVSDYLIRKAIGETPEAFRERCTLAQCNYHNHFGTVVDTLAGMLAANDEETNREWGEFLGDESDPQSVAGRLTIDAVGDGTGWDTVWRQLSTELIETQVHWVLVDSEAGQQRVRLIAPECVPNWRTATVEMGGETVTALTDVVVMEEADTRGSIEEAPGTVTRYVHYGLEGWRRLEKRKDANGRGEHVVLIAEGAYQFTDRHGRPALPIYRVVLPLSRPVGYNVAKSAQGLFNMKSERNHLLRFANFPKLNAAVTDNDTFLEFVKNVKSGSNMLAGAGHAYIAPDTGPATIATDVLKQETDEFYVTAYQQYGDSARQKTATEVAQETASGVGAFLQMLKVAVDDAENEALWRVEQIEWPTDTARWFVAHVERSGEFAPQDVGAAMDRSRKTAFGDANAVPLGRTGQIALATQVAGYLGADVVESEVAAAVDLHNLKDALDVLRDLPQSETAKAMLAMRAYETLGIVQAEGATAADLPEGASKPADRAVVLRELQDNAQASARQAQLAADFFGNGAPGTPPAAPPMDGTTPDPNAPAPGDRMAA